MTKFYSATFDTGVFDSSRFDIISKGFVQFLNSHDKLMDGNKELVTFTRVSNTLDTEGMVTASSETSDSDVEVYITSTTEEERMLVGRGVSKEGMIKVIANRAYDLTNNGDSTMFEVGDYITRTSDGTNSNWRIEVINREYAFGGEIFRNCILRRMEA